MMTMRMMIRMMTMMITITVASSAVPMLPNAAIEMYIARMLSLALSFVLHLICVQDYL